jgi:hypothetical protein
VAASLDDWRPDAVLIEGPPDAEPVLGLAASSHMRPPVALLGYSNVHPAEAVFYPMAAWSPEWVALRWALDAGATVKMIDLPVAVVLASRAEAGADTPLRRAGTAVGRDPLSRLAELAGYDDTERWWEDMVEHRRGDEPWEALAEAVGELRAAEDHDRPAPPEPPAGGEPPTGLDPPEPPAEPQPPAGPQLPAGPHPPAEPAPPGRLDPVTEARREAAMRQAIRAADKAFDRVAVVCGAWHAPALIERGPARPDQALLSGLPRTKATVTWVPWTNDRLSLASGYGAGVASPGWYEHLFVSPDRPIERWMVRVAGLLRAEHLDAAPASVIEAVRLADALAVMRDRPLAGLSECTDAVRAILTGGYDDALSIIGRKLVVGEAVGEVPPETPMVALASDLAARQKRLRLAPAATIKTLELDLRKGNDLERSRLLHRLDLLNIPWGVPDDEARGTGTFRETWTLAWAPELAVRVVEASVYGTTVAAAAAQRSSERAERVDDLSSVATLMIRCLMADLPEAVAACIVALDAQAARSNDVNELMAAVPPLARVMRYGTVRRTDAAAVEQVVRSLVARISVSLIPACASLDDEAAATSASLIAGVSSALGALDDAGMRAMWLDALTTLADSSALHGLVAGRSSRILADAGRLGTDALADRLAAALSRGEDPGRAAAWIEGLVAGSGLLLVHDRLLLAVIDGWLAGVSEAVFDDVVPLLRRAFSEFEAAERRMIAESAGRLDGSGTATKPTPGAAGLGRIDEDRAAAVVPLLVLLMAGRPPATAPTADTPTADTADPADRADPADPTAEAQTAGHSPAGPMAPEAEPK